MKRPGALVMIAVMAFALSACSTGPGAEDPEATVSRDVGPYGLPPASNTPPAQGPSASATEETSSAESERSDADAAVIGQWGGAPEGAPVLSFAPEGRFNGHDGCNTLTGSWTGSGQAFELHEMTMTLIGCPGIDTWLSRAAAVEVDGETLRVTDKDGKDIGTLPRLNVAG
ncbi:META domain-containing protein [Paeniglutamicibacter sulfureus]